MGRRYWIAAAVRYLGRGFDHHGGQKVISYLDLGLDRQGGQNVIRFS